MTDSPTAGVLVRPATPEELRLVRDSWTKGASRGDTRLRGERMLKTGTDRGMRRREFAAAHRLWVDVVLEDHEVHVVVAVAEGEPDEALGWCCWSSPTGAPATLHWVWVRGQARRMGLGRALLAHVREHAAGVPSIAHITPDGSALLEACKW